MSDDVILLDVADRVATITLNRPEARNALSIELLRAIPRTVEEADGRDDVDVIILTGADPAFCAGLDLKAIGRDGGPLKDTGAASDPSTNRRGPMPGHTKPLIGAVNGAAVTGGLEVALNCDFLIASERARFADTHARVGIQPGWGLTVLLPQAIGVRRARQMSATGNFLDAPTALAWGLVNQVVAHDDLLPTCRALAADIVSNDQAAVRRIYRTYEEGTLLDGRGAWELEATVARSDWGGKGGLDPAEVERRREAIMERGRSQI